MTVPTYWVHYKIGGVALVSGPYTEEVAEAHRKDIAGYVGVTDVFVRQLADSLTAWREATRECPRCLREELDLRLPKDGSMSTKLIPGSVCTIFAFMVNSDSDEGRGRGVSSPGGFFWTHLDAQVAGLQRGVFGSDAPVKDFNGVVDVHGRVWVGTLVEVHDGPDGLRKAALRKKLLENFSKAELALLGIKP